MEYRETRGQLKSEMVIVSQELASDCSAEEVLQHPTARRQKQLARGRKKINKHKKPNKTTTKNQNPPQTNVRCSLHLQPSLLPPWLHYQRHLIILIRKDIKPWN